MYKGRPKRPPKTFKEKLFVKELVKAKGNATVAAMKAYDVTSYGAASTIGSQNLAKLDITTVLDNVGATDEKIGKTIYEGMDATKPISVVAGKDASEASVDFIDVPDWQSRLRAAELGAKIKGHMKDTQVDLGDKIMNLVVVKSAKVDKDGKD